MEISWLTFDEAIFYAAIWATGFMAAVFTSLGSGDVESPRKCFIVGGISGFLSFAVVAVFVGRISEPITGHWYYLGISALVGLSANQQELIRQRLLDYVFRNDARDKDPH